MRYSWLCTSQYFTRYTVEANTVQEAKNKWKAGVVHEENSWHDTPNNNIYTFEGKYKEE